MENNFTVDANSTEVAKTLVPLLQIGIAIVAIFAFLLLLIISAFIASIYELYQTSHESPDNTTLITISAVSNTEITNNSNPKRTAPIAFVILMLIPNILRCLLMTCLGLQLIYSDQIKSTDKSPHNSTLSTINAPSNTGITHNSTTNSTSPTYFTSAQLSLSMIVIWSMASVLVPIFIYIVSVDMYIHLKESLGPSLSHSFRKGVTLCSRQLPALAKSSITDNTVVFKTRRWEILCDMVNALISWE
ncbi:uncharacterized protein LOC110828451 [Zootermopsis nevadensis]|uniref:uncharacterized protein LOC110828451 n=1 Tax=Zootermopsis nevadensis TaxID=136037 RepID=UPI000B8EC3DD|nr:uncharacterized protein LOC110828451 [Zootermopsis nevadensis]